MTGFNKFGCVLNRTSFIVNHERVTYAQKTTEDDPIDKQTLKTLAIHYEM